MRRIGILPWPVFKEVRALAVPWTACLLVMVVPVVMSSSPHLAFAWRVSVSTTAYFLGAVALGALSIGQEYTDRTLSLLLSLPTRRKRLLFTKLGVLAAMLLTLGVVAYTLVFCDGWEPSLGRLAASLLPALCGLFIAPCLTIACRSPMAGTVFTMVMPGLLVLPGLLVWWALDRPSSVAFTIAFLLWGMLGLCVVGAIAGWRMFMRLETIEGRDADVDVMLWLRRGTTVLRPGSGRRERSSNDAGTAAPTLTKRHPVWLLIAKELRLQQMTLVVTGLFLIGWFALTVMRPVVPDVGGVFNVATIFYALLIGILTGSLASAEERQLGTLEWQVLLPMGIAKQWAVKIGVVLGLAILLAIGLPILLAHLSPVIDAKPLVGLRLATTILLLAAGSLYVSTLWTSALWALLASLPATAAAAMFSVGALGPVGNVTHTAWSRLFNVLAPSGVDLGRLAPWRVIQGMDLLLIAGLIAMVLWFALANHRSSDRSAGRVGKHAIVMVAFATARVVILSGVAAFLGSRW